MSQAAPFRVGIIGCGNVALRYHIPAYLSMPDRFRIVAVADPSPKQLEAAREAADLDADDALRDPMALIARDDIDVVAVCSPHHLRRAHLEAAAAASKHIISEKPLASTPADALAAVEAAEKAGVLLGIIHNYLMLPEVVKAIELIHDGRIGTVRTAVIDFQGVPDGEGAAGFQPRWRHELASGGGVLMDMLHAVYLGETLLGAEYQSASAFVDSHLEGDQVESVALCRFETAESVALVNVAWGLGPGGFSVTGDQGRIVVRYEDGGTTPWAPFDTMELTTQDGTERVDLPHGDERITLQRKAITKTIAAFGEALNGAGQLAASGRDGLRSLEATVAAYAAAASSRNVNLPLDHTSPLFLRGAAGIPETTIDPASVAARKGLFGIAPA
jgi:Predicted dehydrogenases and related proteins